MRNGRRALVSSSGARPLHRRGRARVGAARSRCRGAAALLPEAKHQPRPSDPVLAHLRADDREQAAPHTHRAPRAEHGSNSQGLPRRADAISKAGVRRLDTGRVVRHGRERQRRPTLTIASTIHATRTGRSRSTGKQASAIWAAVRGSRRASRTCAFCECARQHVGAGRTVAALAFAQMRSSESAGGRVSGVL